MPTGKNAAVGKSRLCWWIAVGSAVLAGTGPALAETPAVLANACANCHGPDGHSPGAIPAIDALGADELQAALEAYRDGSREGTIMNRIAKGYSDAEITAIAGYMADHAAEAGQ